MKSLLTLILSHILISIFMTVFLVYGQITRPFLIIFLLALPVLNKGQRLQKIKSKKRRLLNASLCFILVSLPQLITNSMDWRYLLFLTICIVFSLVYFLMIFALSLKARYSTRGLHLEDDDQSEIPQITYSKQQIKLRSWLVGTSIPTLYLFILFSKKVLLENHSITDFFLQFLELKMIAFFLLVGLGVGSIFGTMTYYFLSEHEEQ